MGIEIIEEVKTTKRAQYTCDVCLKITDSPVICCMCRRVLCREHFVFDSRDSGDYPDKYCQNCWKVWESYRGQIERLQNECDDAKDELERQWKLEATKR